MKIEILGSGCKKCTNLAAEVERVATELTIPFELEKVTDMAQIMGYGVMSTPAIVLNGVVASAGSVPAANAIAELLNNANG